MIFNRTSRAKVHEAERLWIAKFILRLLTIIIVIIAFGLAGYNWNNEGQLYINFRESWAIWIAIPLACSLIWNVANIIVRLSRPRPMHPGANVGVDLVIWAAFLATLVFFWADSIYGLTYHYYCYYYSYDSCSNNESDYENSVRNMVSTSLDLIRYLCSQPGRPKSMLQQPSFVPLLCKCPRFIYSIGEHTNCLRNSLSHFTLFVWACVDTSQRNKANVDVRAAAIAASMVDDMQRRGLLAPTQERAPQHQAQYNAPNETPGILVDSYYGSSSDAGQTQYAGGKRPMSPMRESINPASPIAPHAAHMV